VADPIDFPTSGVTAVPKPFHGVQPLVFLVIATILEVSGDAVVRMGIYNHVGAVRLAWFIGGAILLFGYGLMVNLAPLEFGQLVGLRCNHHVLETHLAPIVAVRGGSLVGIIYAHPG
jgi:hypothetical protein